MDNETHKPIVSILVPIYNVEGYLEECLSSAQVQTFTDIEIICINDGSTDRSREIIGSYMQADPRFKVIDKPNSGYGASMNQGLDFAQGEYITILESDDYIEKNTVEILVDTIKKYDAEVVKANFYFYWSNPEKHELFEMLTPEMTNRLVNPQIESDIYYLKPSIWSALYKASFLKDNDIRFLETPGASYQDAGFNFKVWASATKAVFLSEAYLHYRQDNEASSVNSPGKVYCVCDEYEEMDRYLQERPEKLERLTPIKAKMKYDSYMWNYERLAPEFRYEFAQRMAKDFNELDKSGAVDLQLFEPWKQTDLELIMQSPDFFHALRSTQADWGTAKKMMHYVKIGGFPLLFKRLRSNPVQR